MNSRPDDAPISTYVADQTILYRAALRTLPQGVILMDPEGRVLEVSASAALLLGMAKAPPDDGTLIERLLDIDGLRAVIKGLRDAPAERHWTVEVQHGSNGDSTPLSVQSARIEDIDGTVLGFLVTLREGAVTPAAPDSAIARERDLLAATIRAARDAIVLLSESNEVLAQNPAAYRILRTDTFEQFPPLLRRWLTRARTEGRLSAYEIDIGDESFHILAAPVPDTGMVFTMHNITYLRELARLKDEFVATVSHDLRSPLTSILGYATVARRTDTTNDLRELALQRIIASAERMMAQIQDLLDIAKIEAGFEQQEIEWISLEESARNAAEDLQGAAMEKGLEMALDLAPTPRIAANASYISQVWQNLISNAIKYTPRGQITVRTRSLGDHVEGQVSDTGVGIAAQDVPFIFDKFYRAAHDTDEEIAGAGLGLALVKSVIEKHGGRIWVDSTPGQGSTFTFILPIQQAAR